jgi:hypothetical protein
VPKVDDMSTIINAMKRDDYFVTSGKVLISSYAVEWAGTQRRLAESTASRCGWRRPRRARGVR